jgi:hypothetical protein
MERQKRSGGGRRPAQGHDVEGGRRGEALDPGRGGADRAETTWGGTQQSSEVRGDGARVAAAVLGWRRRKRRVTTSTD